MKLKVWIIILLVVYILIKITVSLNVAVMNSMEVKSDSGHFTGFSSEDYYEKRFNEIKKDLPSGGIVGYISDNDDVYAHSWTREPYMIARYTLAPLIVAPDADHNIVIGNFHSEINIETYKRKELELVKDYKNGVMLFKKRPE